MRGTRCCSWWCRRGAKSLPAACPSFSASQSSTYCTVYYLFVNRVFTVQGMSIKFFHPKKAHKNPFQLLRIWAFSLQLRLSAQYQPQKLNLFITEKSQNCESWAQNRRWGKEDRKSVQYRPPKASLIVQIVYPNRYMNRVKVLPTVHVFVYVYNYFFKNLYFCVVGHVNISFSDNYYT